METKTRLVATRIDDLANILKHYMDPADLPEDAAPVAMQTSQAENRKLCIVFTHPSFVGETEQLIDVQLKRVYSV